MKCFKCDKSIRKVKESFVYNYDDNAHLRLCVSCHVLTMRKYKDLIHGNCKIFGLNDDKEAMIIKIIFFLRRDPDRKNGARRIANFLFSEGYRNRKGNMISEKQVNRIFKREKIYEEEGII